MEPKKTNHRRSKVRPHYTSRSDQHVHTCMSAGDQGGHCRLYMDATRSMPLASMTVTASGPARNRRIAFAALWRTIAYRSTKSPALNNLVDFVLTCRVTAHEPFECGRLVRSEVKDVKVPVLNVSSKCEVDNRSNAVFSSIRESDQSAV